MMFLLLSSRIWTVLLLFVLLLLEWRWFCLFALALQDQQPADLILAHFEARGSKHAIHSEADFQVVPLQFINGLHGRITSRGNDPVQRFLLRIDLDGPRAFFALLVAERQGQVVTLDDDSLLLEGFEWLLLVAGLRRNDQPGSLEVVDFLLHLLLVLDFLLLAFDLLLLLLLALACIVVGHEPVVAVGCLNMCRFLRVNLCRG